MFEKSVFDKKEFFHWHPLSWLPFRSAHFPMYNNTLALQRVTDYLNNMPALTQIDAIKDLSVNLQACHEKKGFILHLGDCTECFSDNTKNIIFNKLDQTAILHNLLHTKIHQKIVSIDRIAGQYAKPRSTSVETKNGISLPSYFGDMFNAFPFSEKEREINPIRMFHAYHASKKALKNIDAFYRYNTLLNSHNHYVSHEVLNLYYEACFTQKVDGKFYNVSTHLPWLGMRTATASPAHIEYLRGIANPIGIKVGTSLPLDELVSLIRTLNMNNLPGKIILITRLGATHVESHLPMMINTIQKENLNVLWVCDAVHGNTERLENDYKIRRVDNILKELRLTLKIHHENNSHLSGIHLETTPEAVTECIDHEITESHIPVHYKALVDPRLNHTQAYRIIEAFGEAMQEVNHV